MATTRNNGFVFAATGEGYTALAIKAAHSLKAQCEDYPVDLFTDSDPKNPIFDRVHQLKTLWHRPKMESLYRSRFSKTVYLDADLYVTADISDIFEILDRFDLVASHDQYPNSIAARKIFKQRIPAVFPQYNSGVIGVRNCDSSIEFLKDWEDCVRDSGATHDQPAFRECLFGSSLRFGTLPPEYNLHNLNLLKVWSSEQAAPRVIHHWDLHRHISKRFPEIVDLEGLVGSVDTKQLNRLIEADRTLSPVRRRIQVHPLINPKNTLNSENPMPNRWHYLFQGTRGEKWVRAIKRMFVSRYDS